MSPTPYVNRAEEALERAFRAFERKSTDVPPVRAEVEFSCLGAPYMAVFQNGALIGVECKWAGPFVRAAHLRLDDPVRVAAFDLSSGMDRLDAALASKSRAA